MTPRLQLTPDVQRRHKPYQPFGAALAFLMYKGSEVLLDGPAGTGKSRVALEKIHILCEKHPRLRALIIRKTRNSCTESVLVTFEEKVLPEGHYLTAGASRNNRQAYHYNNKSTIVVGGMDNAARIMSTEFDIIYVPEATELTESDWEFLLTRINRGTESTIKYNQLMADCNPGPPTHWLNQRCNAGKCHRLVSRHEDNPGLYDHDRGAWKELGLQYLANLDRLSGVRHARLRMGIWAAAEGLIYDQFDGAIHLVDRFEIPAGWKRVRSIDFGFTNPFVCQWWAISPDNAWYLYREIYYTQRLVEDHAKQIKELSKGEIYVATYADHDAEDRATLQRHGVSTVAANKAVGAGIQTVQTAIRPEKDGKPRLFIMRGCLVDRDPALGEAKKPTCTEEELPSYVWQKGKDGKPLPEVPVKEDDHGCDAMRYALHTYKVKGGPRGLLPAMPT